LSAEIEGDTRWWEAAGSVGGRGVGLENFRVEVVWSAAAATGADHEGAARGGGWVGVRGGRHWWHNCQDGAWSRGGQRRRSCLSYLLPACSHSHPWLQARQRLLSKKWTCCEVREEECPQ
jgi:hypothetical protein